MEVVVLPEYCVSDHVTQITECACDGVEDSLTKSYILSAYRSCEFRIIYSFCHSVCYDLCHCHVFSKSLTGPVAVQVNLVLDLSLHAGIVLLEPCVTDKVLQLSIFLWSILPDLMSHLMHEHIAKVLLGSRIGIEDDGVSV